MTVYSRVRDNKQEKFVCSIRAFCSLLFRTRLYEKWITLLADKSPSNGLNLLVVRSNSERVNFIRWIGIYPLEKVIHSSMSSYNRVLVYKSVSLLLVTLFQPKSYPSSISFAAVCWRTTNLRRLRSAKWFPV